MNYGSLLDSLVDAAVDHVVPDDLDAEEQLADPDETAQSLYKDSTEGKNLLNKLLLAREFHKDMSCLGLSIFQTNSTSDKSQIRALISN